MMLLVIPALLFAPVAVAAPTCQNRDGTTIRCGAAGALPVGQTVAPEEFNRRQAALQADSDPHALSHAIYFVCLLLALIAFLPEFDGRTDADWDEQERDNRER